TSTSLSELQDEDPDPDNRYRILACSSSFSSLVLRRGEKKFTRFPSGSRNSIERLPHGWVLGSSTNACTIWLIRAYSLSTSSTSKSKTMDRFVQGVVALAPCSSIFCWLEMANAPSEVRNSR